MHLPDYNAPHYIRLICFHKEGHRMFEGGMYLRRPPTRSRESVQTNRTTNRWMNLLILWRPYYTYLIFFIAASLRRYRHN